MDGIYGGLTVYVPVIELVPVIENKTFQYLLMIINF